MAVAEKLRDEKQMATEGLIGDSLKSTPLFFLCAALHERFTSCDTKASLCTHIASFPASRIAITVNSEAFEIGTSGLTVSSFVWKDIITSQPRGASTPTDALLIWHCDGQNKRNSARRVSDPRLAAIQQICYACVGGEGIPRSVDEAAFRFDAPMSQARHMVYDSWRQVSLPAVANVWRSRSARRNSVTVLVVLTGNGNDRYIHSSAYDFVVTVTWDHNHETNPTWLRMYLLHLASAAAKCKGGLGAIDVLGLSRGHCALMSCCQYSAQGFHIQLQSQFRHFMAAGGCIWQRQRPSIATQICRGLKGMSEVRGSPIFRLIVISRMDGTTPVGKRC